MHKKLPVVSQPNNNYSLSADRELLTLTVAGPRKFYCNFTLQMVAPVVSSMHITVYSLI